VSLQRRWLASNQATPHNLGVAAGGSWPIDQIRPPDLATFLGVGGWIVGGDPLSGHSVGYLATSPPTTLRMASFEGVVGSNPIVGPTAELESPTAKLYGAGEMNTAGHEKPNGN